MRYDQIAYTEMQRWQKQMQRKPGLLSRLSRSAQQKINSYIPEKVHEAITTAIRQMTRGVLFGATHTSPKPRQFNSLLERETTVDRVIANYRNTASIEGGITGAGGILLGLADFPILIGIKLKLLFDLAALYGFDVKDYRERVYLLHIFQLAFSSQQHRRKIYSDIENWEEKKAALPPDINEFDWRNFQQEYRDYIDLAKLAQLIPGIGAAVGLIVNYKLVKQLGETAKNAYRMRILTHPPTPSKP